MCSNFNKLLEFFHQIFLNSYLCSHVCSQCHQSSSAAISEWLPKQWWTANHLFQSAIFGTASGSSLASDLRPRHISDGNLSWILPSGGGSTALGALARQGILPMGLLHLVLRCQSISDSYHSIWLTDSLPYGNTIVENIFSHFSHPPSVLQPSGEVLSGTNIYFLVVSGKKGNFCPPPPPQKINEI